MVRPAIRILICALMQQTTIKGPAYEFQAKSFEKADRSIMFKS